MNSNASKSQLLRAAACVLLTALFAWVMHAVDARALARIDAMTPADYLAYQRHQHQHSYLFAYVTLLIFGGAYLGAVEVVAGLLGFAVSGKADRVAGPFRAGGNPS
jgi:hypothetical protein